MSEVLGKPFFPWQAYVTDVTLELDAGGSWAFGLACWYVVRRAGKSVGISPVSAVVCSRPDPMQVWLTAQKRENAVKRWKDATKPLVESDLGGLRRLISNSHELLEWPNGSTFVPFGPDEDTMHGEDPDVVMRDEDWSFTFEQAALVEAGYSHAFSVKAGLDIRMSAAGTARSTSMKATRGRGRRAVEEGRRSRVAYFEWCVPEKGPDGRPIIEMPDDMLVELLLLNHPRRGRGVREDFVAEQLDRDRKDALRAYGGIDNDDVLDDAVIDMAAMNRARATVPIPEGVRVAIAVEVDPDSAEGSIVASWVWPLTGQRQVEAIDRRPGVRWMRDAIVSIVGSQPVGLVAVVQAGPSRGLADELDGVLDDGLLLRVPAEDYAAACKRLRDTITEQPEESIELLLHDPRGALWAAVRAAEEKPLRSGLGWRPKIPSEPVSMLGAVALGDWVADRIPKPVAPQKFFVY